MTEATAHHARKEHWCTDRECTTCDTRIRALLAVAMGYDNRRPGDLNVVAWREAASRARWTFDAALEAIHQHYAESTEFLMPAHITQRVKAMRARPPVHAALPAAEPASPETRRRIRDLIGDAFGMPRHTRRARPAPDTAERAARREQARRELDAIRRRTEGAQS